MVRIQVKEIEGVIAIVIFISFLTFYLSVYRSYIFNKVDNYNQINYYNSYIKNILNNIEDRYYLLSFNVTIPISMYYQCLQSSSIYNNLINDNAYNDFCSNFPISYPLNISFLTSYSGVLNNTNNTYLDPNVGLFFYLNIANLNLYNQPQYALVNISNPSGQNLNNYPVFVTSPDIFYWLQEGYNLNVTDLNGNQYYFCYLNSQFNCSNINNNAYGIWIDLNISKNRYIILNISPISNNNPYSVDGSQIFPFYDHFTYQNYQQFSQNWYNNTPISITPLNPGDQISSSSFKIYSKKTINKGYYLILFNIQNINSLSSGNINIGDSCKISLQSNNKPYFYYCNVNDNNVDISISANGRTYAYYLILIPYNIIPRINIIYQPNITQTFNFIIGPNLTYDFSQYNDLIKGINSIANNYVKYKESSSSYGYIISSTNYFNHLFYYLYTSQYEPSNLGSRYIYNESLSLIYLYSTQNLSIKKILFSNTSWFILNTQKYYNSSNMIYWNTSQNNYGFTYNIINFYNLLLSYDNSLLNNYLYYPYENGIILSNSNNFALLFTNYYPLVNITLNITVSNSMIYSNTNYYYLLNLTLLNNYPYQDYYLYFYDNPNLDKETAKYLAFSTQIPIMKINYIEPINIININNLLQESQNYPDIYFYFENENITIYNGIIYQGNVANNYQYSQEYSIYVLNTTNVNDLYKDNLIIYIK
ncbi:MAG: hypothetical protein ACP5GJ_01790 [Nanopusillaceae archaeon]